MKFTELSLEPSLLEGIQVLGFEETTPIQAQAIPPILEGKDVIGCAQTGTGKTAAFLIPTIQKLMQTQAGKIKCLTIVPTRELAVQIDQNMEGLAFYTGVYSVSVYGGNDSKGWDRQKNAITGGVDVVVATPGRFKTHYKLGYMDLSEVEVLILDEADKMLDMGFFEDILEISSYLPKKRQTLMFSATMPPKIRKLAKEILNNPVEITLELAKPAAGVVQQAYMVYDNQKIPLLERLIKNAEVDSMIIFASSKANVDRIASRLRDLNIDARAIHSSRDQQERTATLRAFKNKQFPIVVATDVLSRGIDINSLSHVLNFDVPGDAEDYVHRIGRTARAGSKGAAITFVSPDDMYRFGNIERLIEQEVPKPKVDEDLGETPTYRPGSRGGGRGRSGGGSGGRGGNRSGGNRGGRNSRGGSGGRGGRGGNRNSNSRNRNSSSRNRSGGNSGENKQSGDRQNPRSENKNRNQSRRRDNDNRNSQNKDKS